MSKWKKALKWLGVASVPGLCVYAIAGAVVIPLLVFETGASKEYNDTARKRSEDHWDDNFSTDKDHDALEDNFNFIKAEGADGNKATFKVDGRDSYIYELTDKDKNVVNEHSDKLMIFSHGLNSTHWNVMESAFYWAALGYRVVAWDQRGGGDNRDSHITFGFAEADDLNDLYTTITSDSTLLDGAKEITMYGQSNGAATTISFADRYQDSVTKAEKAGVKTRFIEESGYTSPKRQFETALNLHGIMPAAVVPLTIPMYELYADKNLSDKNADYLAQSVNIAQPLFIVHGDKDPIVAYEMGVELYQTMMAQNRHPENQPSIIIGEGLKHIGVSRDSDINNDPDLLKAVEAYFVTGLKSSSDVNEAKSKYSSLEKQFTDKKKNTPLAVRFFTEVYCWDRWNTHFEDLGGDFRV